MTNRRSPVLTCCPSVKARFCRKPSTRDTRLTVLTAWTRPTKVPAGVTLFRAAAATVTAGGVAAADAWSEVEDRPQPQSAAATRMIVPRIAPQGRRRILEFLPFHWSRQSSGRFKADAQRPMDGKTVSIDVNVYARAQTLPTAPAANRPNSKSRQMPSAKPAAFDASTRQTARRCCHTNLDRRGAGFGRRSNYGAAPELQHR